MSEEFKTQMLTTLLQNGSGTGVSFHVDGTAILSIMEEVYEKGRKEAEDEIRAALEKKSKEQYITRAEAKKLLGKSDSTLWKWDKAGYLPATHRGGSVFYNRQLVLDILEGRK